MELEDTFQLSQVVEYTNYDLPLFPIDLECFERGYPLHPCWMNHAWAMGIKLHVALCMGAGPLETTETSLHLHQPERS